MVSWVHHNHSSQRWRYHSPVSGNKTDLCTNFSPTCRRRFYPWIRIQWNICSCKFILLTMRSFSRAQIAISSIKRIAQVISLLMASNFLLIVSKDSQAPTAFIDKNFISTNLNIFYRKTGSNILRLNGAVPSMAVHILYLGHRRGSRQTEGNRIQTSKFVRKWKLVLTFSICLLWHLQACRLQVHHLKEKLIENLEFWQLYSFHVKW